MDKPIKSRFENHLIEKREVRIFLSSTFSDMEAERSALVKLFNRLKYEANRRNINLSLLDLRWGVTDEEARTGKVLSVCLNEIENSHPFFIGLLGCRYGYSPDAIEFKKNPELKERYPWLSQDIEQGKSITEIEMLYGALRNKKRVEAAFFIKNTPDMQPDDNVKLTKLKTKIRKQRRFHVTNYCSIDDLCVQVEKVVTNLLDKYFKSFDETRHKWRGNLQRAFINCRHSPYIQRQEDLCRLNQFLNSKEQYLLVTGPSGLGKSALIANWLKKLESRRGGLPCMIIYHFLGNAFGSNTHEEVLMHICDELIIQNYCRETILEDYESPKQMAQRYMSEAVKKGKSILIIIDGINQISTSCPSLPFDWLPRPHPKVRYIFSSIDDNEIAKAFHFHGYPIYTLKPFDNKQKYSFILEYLSLVGKKLNKNQYSRIVHFPLTNNVLVLKSLLDELICFGSYEHLDERINLYISIDSIADFFDRILQRMEKDFEGAPQLLSLISVSEHGLSESEIVGITGIKNMDFHLLHCAYTTHITSYQGLYNFSHQYIKDAVKRRYLKDPSSIEIYRQKVILYFSNNSDIVRRRRILELAYQYYSLYDMKNLYAIILNFHTFNYLYCTIEGENKLALYWKRLRESNPTQYRFSDYLSISHKMAFPTRRPYLEIASFLCKNFSNYDVSLGYAKEFLKIEMSKKGKDLDQIAKALIWIGTYYKKLKKYEKALNYFFRLLENYEKIIFYDIRILYEEMDEEDYFDKDIMQNYIFESYIHIGEIYYFQGNINKALDVFLKALKNSKNVIHEENHPYFALCYHYIGRSYEIMEKHDKAIRYYQKALGKYKKLYGDFYSKTVAYYFRIGELYYIQENYAKALEYYFKTVSIYKIIDGSSNEKIAKCYLNIGRTYECQDNYVNALDYYNRALGTYSDVLGDSHPTTIAIYGFIGNVYYNKRMYDKALEAYTIEISFQEKILGLENKETAVTYHNLGDVYERIKEYDKGLYFYSKALDIFLRGTIRDIYNAATCYYEIGRILDIQEEYEKALKNYNYALVLYEKDLDNNYLDVANCCEEIGGIYEKLEDYNKALQYNYKALEVYQKAYGMEHTTTADSYCNVGWDYLMQKIFDKALYYYSKALVIREVNLGKEHIDTATTYYNIGYIYEELDNYSKALEYNLKVMGVYESIYGYDNCNTADSYSDVGWNYLKLKKYNKALEFYTRAYSILIKILGTSHPDTVAVKEKIDIIKIMKRK